MNRLDIQLIKELEKKLYEYTFEQDETKFNTEEVETICKLLDILEAKEEEVWDADTSFELFKKRYEEEERNAAKKKKNSTIRKILPFAAAILLVFLTVNVGTYATKEKSFFEVLSDEDDGIEVHIKGTGEVGEKDEFSGIKQAEVEYLASWEEVDENIRKEIFEPKEIPEGFELQEIVQINSDFKKVVMARYQEKNSDHYFKLQMEVFQEESTNMKIKGDEMWSFVEERTMANRKVRYFQKEGEIKILFLEKSCFGCIVSNMGLQDVERTMETILKK